MIALLQEIQGNSALFENNEAEGEDKGAISWLPPTQLQGGSWPITFQGKNAKGGTIPVTTIEYPEQSTAPTPSQVFWWVAQKLKSTLCPSCI